MNSDNYTRRAEEASAAFHLPPYPAYNPSGVEWPGDVPAHWEVRRLRNIVNSDSVKTGYAISFTRYFYKPQPLRPPHTIWADIRALEQEAEGLLGEIFNTEGVNQ